MAAWLLTRAVASAGQADQTGTLLYSPDACDCAWAKAEACGGTGDGSICWPHCCKGFIRQNFVPQGGDSPDACDCAWAKAEACSGTGDGSVCWPHCCQGFMELNSVPRGDDRPGEDETRHDDLSLDRPSFASEEGGYREGAARLVTALQKTRHGPSVTIYCQGDSTMLRQVAWFSRMLQQEAEAGTYARQATWDGSAQALDLAKIVPGDFPPGSRASVDGGHFCDRPSMLRTRGSMQGYNISFISVVCTRSLLQISSAMAAIRVLRAAPYAYTELESPSLVYLGGAGLHHLHDEETRSYGQLRPYIAADLFEERLRSALKLLQDFVPPATKMAYFNTHAVCDEKLPSGIQARATACAGGDEQGCFGCVDGPNEQCAPIDNYQRIGFNATLLSAHGAQSLAQREATVLNDATLRPIRLVDGHAITTGKCDATTDGRHYVGVEAIEANAALDAIAVDVLLEIEDPSPNRLDLWSHGLVRCFE